MSWLDDLKRCLEREPKLTPDVVVQVIQREWRGQSVYVSARPPRPELEPTDTPQTIQRKFGVSRSTSYAWINAWRR